MRQKTVIALALMVSLAACAAEEEVIVLEEPAMMDEAIAAEPVMPCETGDEDGIGGTGCEPLE